MTATARQALASWAPPGMDQPRRTAARGQLFLQRSEALDRRSGADAAGLLQQLVPQALGVLAEDGVDLGARSPTTGRGRSRSSARPGASRRSRRSSAPRSAWSRSPGRWCWRGTRGTGSSSAAPSRRRARCRRAPAPPARRARTGRRSTPGRCTFLDGSCSGNRLPSERRVGRFRITPTWPPLGAGAATSTVWRYSRSRNAGCATRMIASSCARCRSASDRNEPERAAMQREERASCGAVYDRFASRIATRAARAFLTSSSHMPAVSVRNTISSLAGSTYQPSRCISLSSWPGAQPENPANRR